MFRQGNIALLAFVLINLTGCVKGEPPVEATSEPVASEPVSEDQPQTATSDCQLTMGWDPWEPYQYRDIGGEVRGLDVELISTLAEKAGCEIDFEENDWATLLGLLRQGKVDLLTGATRTEGRERYAYFSAPYRDESFALYVRATDSEKYAVSNLKTLMDDDFRLGVTSEYIYGDDVSELEDNPKYQPLFRNVPVGEVNYAKLLDMEIDGFLEDPFVAATILRRKGLGDQIALHTIQFPAGNVRIMFSKESVEPATVQAFNDSLATMRKTGSYAQILEKYRN